MICLIVLIVAGILGIFSASQRKLAKEAFHCVFRQTTFRKCNSGMDVRIKSSLVAKLMRFSPNSAKVVYRHFGLLSWIFTILMVVSFIWSGFLVYNIVVYNNCNGPDPSEFCIITGNGGITTPGDIVDCKDPLCVNGTCVECGEDCECHDCEEP